jgi:hypothetical protein
LFSLFYQAHSDLAQALDSNSNPHQALAPKDFLSECLFLSNAKSRDLFGKGVQGIPLPEREVSSHLLLFPKKLR